MRLVHDPSDGDRRVLADTVDVADSFGAKLRGLTFRRSIPDGYALVFEFDRAARRSVHMLFVPFPVDVVWTVDGSVTGVRTLPAWYGLGWATGDRFVELPAGAAGDVAPGDRIGIERE